MDAVFEPLKRLKRAIIFAPLIAIGAWAGPALADPLPQNTIDAKDEPRNSISLLPAGAFTASPAVVVVMDGHDFGFGSSEAQQVTASLALRYGLSSHTEIQAVLPFGRTRARATLFGQTESATRTTGIAQIGLRQLITNGTEVLPEVVAGLELGLPMGNLQGAEPHARISLAAVEVADPIILSAEIGAGFGTRTRQLNLDFEGQLEFSINERISLGVGVGWTSAGARFGDPLKTGVSVTGSVTLGAPSGKSALTPFVSLGASEAAPDVALGLSWTRRW